MPGCSQGTVLEREGCPDVKDPSSFPFMNRELDFTPDNSVEIL